MDITEELEETVDLEAPYKGETIKFTAYKESLTPGFVRNIASLEGYPKAVSMSVKNWDVTARGEKVGLDEESLSAINTKLLGAVINRIGETWSGDEAKKKP